MNWDLVVFDEYHLALGKEKAKICLRKKMKRLKKIWKPDKREV